ncbi:MAG: PadR family transcriptional regulator [Acidimicrobiia bacterium]
MPSRDTARGARAVHLPDLSLTEWAVLGVLSIQPAHGFAVARELQRDAPVGQVWSIQRPLVYRALNRLEEQALIRPHATEPGAGGPQRTVYRIERRGRTALERWLHTPVRHLRDVRTELLLKLVLGDRLGVDQRQLLVDQRAQFAPHFSALALPTSGPIDPVTRWRHESSQSVARFLDGLLARRKTS